MTDDVRSPGSGVSSEEPERVTPRVLVRIDLAETPSRKPKSRYEAQTPDGTIHGGNRYDKTIVGFAEFAANTRLTTKEDREEFRDQIESKAEYVHWKPEVDR